MDIQFSNVKSNPRKLTPYQQPGYRQLLGDPAIGDKIVIDGQELTLIDLERMLVDINCDDDAPWNAETAKPKIDYLFHWGWYCNGCGNYHELKSHWKLPDCFACDDEPQDPTTPLYKCAHGRS